MDIWQDSVIVNGTVPFMRTEYFLDKLKDLDHFDGFSPRWILPISRMQATNSSASDNVSTQILLMIDSTLENKVGIGLNNFPVVYLQNGEAIV